MAGGERVEFGDTAFATATFFVISIFFYLMPPIFMIFQYIDVSLIISVFVAGLIVGAIYAHKLGNEKVKSVLKILVLSAVLLAFFNVGMTFTDWNTYTQAAAGHPNIATTADEFLQLMPYWTTVEIVLGWVIGGPFAFLGLYLGSMVRKSKTS
jgi:hypothetical protein